MLKIEHLKKHYDNFSLDCSLELMSGCVTGWLPIVAAARMAKNKPDEKELLEHWVNVVDFQ